MKKSFVHVFAVAALMLSPLYVRTAAAQVSDSEFEEWMVAGQKAYPEYGPVCAREREDVLKTFPKNRPFWEGRALGGLIVRNIDETDVPNLMAQMKDEPRNEQDLMLCITRFVIGYNRRTGRIGPRSNAGNSTSPTSPTSPTPATPTGPESVPLVSVNVLRKLGDDCVSVRWLKTVEIDRDSYQSTFELRNGCASLELVEVLDDDMRGYTQNRSVLARGIWQAMNFPPQLIESYPTNRRRAPTPTKAELGFDAFSVDASPEKGSFTVGEMGIMERKIFHTSSQTVLEIALASCRTWRLPIEPIASYRDAKLEHWKCKPLFLPPGQ